MMVDVLLVSIIAFVSMFVPGVLLALALLKDTKLSMFEIIVIGFIFGLIAPATLTWLESYLIAYAHFFAFSLSLFEINAAILTIIGFLLCMQQGVFKDLKMPSLKLRFEQDSQLEEIKLEKDFKKRVGMLRARLEDFEAAKEIIKKHSEEERILFEKQSKELSNISVTPEERQKIEKLHRDEEERLFYDHEQEEMLLLNKLKNESGKAPEQKPAQRPGLQITKMTWVWIILLFLMLLTFATRMMSVGITPKFFEFDPYFDMMATKFLLTYGQQILYSPSAWPVLPSGTIFRIQPLVPYLEAYWYDLANAFGPNYTTLNNSLLSYVGGIYPPITAALLVFVIFMLLYHEYDEKIALIGAALTATMPVLFTTFVSGEQLLEPWGIFSLFFFFAAYLLAVKNMKSTRLAIFAGIAFASTFLGAHYYTVDTGVLVIYILIQGVIDVLRGDMTKYFYKMNIIVIVVISIFLILYHPYHATLTGRIPSVLGIPITISGPLFALIIIAIFDFVPKFLHKQKLVFKRLNTTEYLEWMFFLLIVLLLLVSFTKLGAPLRAYINLSKKFTTPSSPLFMTVEEYIPTGLLYNFGANGFGLIGASLSGVPIMVWLISAIAIILILINIVFRNEKSGVFYLAIALPLMVAGFSEVKYLPHFGVAFIMLFSIMLGEIIYLSYSNFNVFDQLKLRKEKDRAAVFGEAYESHTLVYIGAISLGLFFVSPLLALILLLILIFSKKFNQYNTKLWAMVALIIIIEIGSQLATGSIIYGESSSIISAFSASAVNSASPSTACTTLSNHGNSIGIDLYCNVVPDYWLAAGQWMSENVGPYGPRLLAWWDYGDWINWFGNSNAVIRGDNAVPAEDEAVAANYVLGPKDGYTTSVLANMMNTNQTKYIIFDQGLIQKWQALDFLACVHVNETSEAYAIAQGKSQSPPVPFVLGNSPCEIAHDPQFVLLPLPALIPSANTTQNLEFYCPISNSSVQYIRGFLVTGSSLSNQSVCIKSVPTSTGAVQEYNSNGSKINAMIQVSDVMGEVSVSGIPFLEFLNIYTPNGPNDNITDAPTEFYDSNFYKGFFFGNLTGFKQVYPSNTTSGTNMINGTIPLRILALDNFTGSLPAIPPKPSYIHNNYTVP